MNWIFTRPSGGIRFEKGEPFCHIFPVRRGKFEPVDPVMRQLSEAPELKRQHEKWTASRANFNAELEQHESPAAFDKWQKRYYCGLAPNGEPPPIGDHRIRLRLPPFRRKPSE